MEHPSENGDETLGNVLTIAGGAVAVTGLSKGENVEVSEEGLEAFTYEKGEKY